jgi:glycerol kinase
MGRKKLLYILHNVQIGGVEVALLSAIPDLNKKYDLRVLALGTVDHQIISNLTENEKVSFIRSISNHTFTLFGLANCSVLLQISIRT